MVSTKNFFESLKELNLETNTTNVLSLLTELEKIKIKKPVNQKKWRKKLVVINGKVEIHKTAKIMPFTVIEGPVKILKKAIIRPHTWVRPNTIIGKNTVIGKGSEIKNSVIGNNAKIGTNCFAGDSVLGKAARLGSGTILSNRRFDQKIIKIKIDSKTISTKKDKFGAILGDYTRTGANATLSPGTLIEKHSWVLAKNIHGYLKKNTLYLEKNSEIQTKPKPKIILKDTDLKGKK